MDNYGQRVLDKLNTYNVGFISPGSKKDTYNVDTKNFKAEVYVLPGKSFGIEITLRSNPKLEYSFDDDLYNMSNFKYADLFTEMENDILAIIDALYANTIIKGSRNGRPAMAVPEHNKYQLVYLTKFFGKTGTKTYSTLEELIEKGNFIASA